MFRTNVERAPSSFEPLESRRLLAASLALTTANELLAFDTASPGTVVSTTRITNLQAGESIVAIDVRPATGQLYGLGSTSGQSLFSINLRTGAATKLGDLGGSRMFSDIAIRPA